MFIIKMWIKRSKTVKINQKQLIESKSLKKIVIFDGILHFSIRFQFFDQICSILIEFKCSDWIQTCFNQICCIDVKSDNKFRSKIWLNSDRIKKFFEILAQFDLIALA